MGYGSVRTSYDRGLKQTVDWRLIGCYLALVLIGWVNIYASIHSTEPSSIFDLGSRSGKQFLWICISLVVDFLVLFVLTARFWEVIPGRKSIRRGEMPTVFLEECWQSFPEKRLLPLNRWKAVLLTMPYRGRLLQTWF